MPSVVSPLVCQLPQSLHKNSQVHWSGVTSERSNNILIPRRLADFSSNAGRGSSSHSSSIGISEAARVYCESGEVEPRPFSVPHFSGSQVRSSQIFSETYGGENRQSIGVCDGNEASHIGSGGSLAEVVGSDGQHGGHSALLQVQNETDSVATFKALQTQHSSIIQGGSHVTNGVGRAAVVVTKTNLTVGVQFPYPDHQVVLITDASLSGWGGHVNSNLARGIWSPLESREHINVLEMWAVERSLLHLIQFVVNKKSLSQIRQLHSGSLYQQARGYQVPISVSSRSKDVVMVYGPQNSVESQSHPRCRKRPSRQSVEMEHDSTHGVDPVEAGVSDLTNSEGVPNDRSVCISSKSPAASLLLSRAGRQRVRLRRDVDRLDRDGSVCISSDLSVIRGSSQDLEGGLHSSSNSPHMASSDVVPNVVATDGGCPDKSTIRSRHSEDAGNTAQISQCTVSKTCCWTLSSNGTRRRDFLNKLPIWSPEVEEIQHSEYILHVSDRSLLGVNTDRYVQVQPLSQI